MTPPAPDAVELAGRSLALGFHSAYTATVDGGVRAFSEPMTRATVSVRDAGQRIDHVWEWRNSGTAGLPLRERTATRR